MKMRRTPSLGFALIVCVAITILLPVPGAASAQDVTEPALKAAFIYNFAKFTEWPGDVVPAEAPLVMCVLGDAAVRGELERVVETRLLAGHRMAVVEMASTGRQQACHLLYVSGIPATEATQIVANLRDVPVLTISDLEGFTALGGIAHLYFQNGQLRFNIEHESAKRARLKISSRLLALARNK